MMVVVRFFNRRPDVSGTQHRENERLQKRHEQFQSHHEQGQRDGGRYACRRAARAFARFAKNKNEAHERENHDVTCCDVGKKTEQQRERLEEQAEYLDWGQD